MNDALRLSQTLQQLLELSASLEQVEQNNLLSSWNQRPATTVRNRQIKAEGKKVLARNYSPHRLSQKISAPFRQASYGQLDWPKQIGYIPQRYFLCRRKNAKPTKPFARKAQRTSRPSRSSAEQFDDKHLATRKTRNQFNF